MMMMLVGLLLKSLAVAAITLLALRVTRGRSAAERSLIAHLGLLALVALPVATLLLPSLNLPLPEAMRSQIVQAASRSAPINDAAPTAIEQTKVASEPVASAAATPQLAPMLRALAPYAYALPALALLLLTIAALAHLARLRARAEVLVDPVWLSALAHAQRRMGHKSGTALLVSDSLPSPISWGLARPTILLSADALAASGEAEAIIAHELAHVAAFDWVKLMLARVATAIHWFNPLAWRLAREAHQLREEAADDMVLGAEIAAPDYAQLLVRVARHESKGLLLGAHGVAPSKGSLKRRVGRVLDTALPRTPARGSWMAGFGAGMLVMAAPLAALSVGAAQEVDARSAADTASTPVPRQCMSRQRQPHRMPRHRRQSPRRSPQQRPRLRRRTGMMTRMTTTGPSTRSSVPRRRASRPTISPRSAAPRRSSARSAWMTPQRCALWASRPDMSRRSRAAACGASPSRTSSRPAPSGCRPAISGRWPRSVSADRSTTMSRSPRLA
jgi:bla regulator protein BlaR1